MIYIRQKDQAKQSKAVLEERTHNVSETCSYAYICEL